MALNARLLKFDSSGRIRCTDSAPEELSNANTPTIQGLLSLQWTSPAVFLSGLGYTADRKLAIDPSSAIDHFSHSGMPITAFGTVAVSQNGIVDHWQAGIPYDASGRVVTAGPEVPVLITGFSNGFSNGFGA